MKNHLQPNESSPQQHHHQVPDKLLMNDTRSTPASDVDLYNLSNRQPDRDAKHPRT